MSTPDTPATPLMNFNDARALFERVITTFPSEHARPLWEGWAHYEYQYGDLEAAQKLEKRMPEVYPSDMCAHLKHTGQRITWHSECLVFCKAPRTLFVMLTAPGKFVLTLLMPSAKKLHKNWWDGRFSRVEKIKHCYAYGWKTGEPIIIA
ncbi:hypothetical protein K503DRAFT_806153 [Rhizopogon vinicolor AM-OR11-026]|uniref:Suppressor of forked domain-containing protein n=1 Tax=Rhizopogon vinicolor AM-OR11-026 TaxID=1314800 RepID=A0A1B7MFF9_9AGAM|nr:hypothetical protein K503DRAFT_806153 [Rhizopogon vinicolor AM-OR11-026]